MLALMLAGDDLTIIALIGIILLIASCEEPILMIEFRGGRTTRRGPVAP